MKLNDNTGACLDAMLQNALRGLEIIGGKAETYTKGHAPVDKTGISGPSAGALRNSITHRVNAEQKQVAVGSTLPWAAYVELGTGKLYEPPPEWIEAHAKRGRGLDHWIYKGGDGKWHMGFPRNGVKFLQRGIKDHLSEYKTILETELKGE